MQIVGKIGVFNEFLDEFEPVWEEYNGKYAEVIEYYEDEDNCADIVIKFLDDDKILTVTEKDFKLI